MKAKELIKRLQELQLPEAEIWIEHRMASSRTVQTRLDQRDEIEARERGQEIWILLNE